MSDVPICSYCDHRCDRRAHYFTIERVERGRVVSRGHACGVGCLMAVASVQRDNAVRAVYESRGHLTEVLAVVEPGADERGSS
jgi:hypothetical protein